MFTRRRRMKIIPSNNRQVISTEATTAPTIALWVGGDEFPCFTVEPGVTSSMPVITELSIRVVLGLDLEREYGSQMWFE